MKCTDKKNCRVYKAGADDEASPNFVGHFCMMFDDEAFRHLRRIVDVVNVRLADAEDDDADGEHRRFGVTADNGKPVEVFAGRTDDDWYAIEIEEEEDNE